MVARSRLSALLVADLGSRFRDPVAEPGKDAEREKGTDEANHDQDRQQVDQPPGTQIILEPRQLCRAEIAEAASFQVHDVDETNEMDPV